MLGKNIQAGCLQGESLSGRSWDSHSELIWDGTLEEEKKIATFVDEAERRSAVTKSTLHPAHLLSLLQHSYRSRKCETSRALCPFKHLSNSTFAESWSRFAPLIN